MVLHLQHAEREIFIFVAEVDVTLLWDGVNRMIV